MNGSNPFGEGSNPSWPVKDKMKYYHSLSYHNEGGYRDFVRGTKSDLLKKYHIYKKNGIGSNFSLTHIRERYDQANCDIFFEVLSSQKLP